MKITSLEQALALKKQGKLLGVFDMPDYIYHSPELGAINNSGFKHLAKSPAHYKAWTNEEQAKTPAMILGTMVHHAILEPEKLETEYAIMPEINRKTNAGKAEYALFCEDNKNKTVVKQEDMDHVKEIACEARKHPYFETLLSEGKAEQSLFWIDDETGAYCKIRVDYLNPKIGLVIDLKTTSKDAGEFGRSIAKYGYHIANAFYLEGIKKVLDMKPDFLFFVVEVNKPYGVKLYKLDTASLLYGKDLFVEYLRLFSDCAKNDVWRGYDYDAETVGLPEWAYK